ncbi:MAG: DNA mismatch repair endonuclease MutL [Phycisphaerales bacterium]
MTLGGADISTAHPVIAALPPLLINQIAAGEVIERPASVVKELLDNAIDAGATRITVDLEQGGVELIRVSDDGHGVPHAQARLMLAPHATSKLRAASDLDAITTMGFRGEALASICSVARVSVRSRTSDAHHAWRIDAEADHIPDPAPDAAPQGTTITVRNLFFNTPARRKFLRTPATEQDHCVETVRALALAHPRIAFRCTADNRELLDLPSRDSPRDRILDVLGPELEPHLLEAHADDLDDSQGAALFAMVGTPEIARATNRAQRIFINGRPIRDKTIQHALREAYRGLMDHSRHPTAVLLLEVPPGAVDVNVHPTKAEVRFRDPGHIHTLVLRAVRDALRAADLTPAVRTALPGQGTQGPDTAAFLRTRTGVLPISQPDSAQPQSLEDFVARMKALRDQARALAGGLVERAQTEPSAPLRTPEVDPKPSGAEIAPLPTVIPAQRVLQVHNSFLVTQDEQGILIVDQHALHERVMFELLMDKINAGALESQRLLTPVVIKASAARLDALDRLRPTLERLAVDASALGPSTIAIHAFPTLLFDRGVDAGEFLEELLEKAERDGLAASQEEAAHEVIDMMSCKAAVKAGDRLSDEEAAILLQLRDRIERGSNCPHGRPTTIRLTVRELEKRFGRT